MKRDPWNLTRGQQRSADAYVQTGCMKRAADQLGVSGKTITAQITRVKKKMGCATLLHALIQWDRFRRGDKDQRWGIVV